jgi:hypothetical protein
MPPLARKRCRSGPTLSVTPICRRWASKPADRDRRRAFQRRAQRQDCDRRSLARHGDAETVSPLRGAPTPFKPPAYPIHGLAGFVRIPGMNFSSAPRSFRTRPPARSSWRAGPQPVRAPLAPQESSRLSGTRGLLGCVIPVLSASWIAISARSERNKDRRPSG